MDKLFCQSCGMPLENDEVIGRNTDCSKNNDYCIYCYKDGEFADNNMSMEQMIDHCMQFLGNFNKDSVAKFSPEGARAKMKKHFPTLKRWKKP